MQNISGKQLSLDNDIEQKLITQRSKSAPQRRKWFQKEHQPTTSFLMDHMVTTRLVNAINIWHDIHSNLIQLNIRKARSNTKLSIQSDISEYVQSDTCVSYNRNFDDSLSIESLSYDSISDMSFSDSSENKDDVTLSNINKNISSFNNDANVFDDNECINSLSVQVINTEEEEWERQNVLNSSVTKEQMKTTIPELSDHWR
ncbi:Hypothetical protein SRAE_X000213600 [Strongyloides ratti]|uniref:Uncharacterized protein n=1 Tax=Strongyloides ratti TaxID=34506 RepID=A0A090MQF3_STRRB|nr:Hypothetical protein SRAE_X000213600 [Strongyloides ratti]CEF60398.1 Hypothetical protein SRAE_X000213600 [Strongyloides ratti]